MEKKMAKKRQSSMGRSQCPCIGKARQYKAMVRVERRELCGAAPRTRIFDACEIESSDNVYVKLVYNLHHDRVLRPRRKARLFRERERNLVQFKFTV